MSLGFCTFEARVPMKRARWEGSLQGNAHAMWLWTSSVARSKSQLPERLPCMGLHLLSATLRALCLASLGLTGGRVKAACPRRPPGRPWSLESPESGSKAFSAVHSQWGDSCRGSSQEARAGRGLGHTPGTWTWTWTRGGQVPAVKTETLACCALPT